MSRLDDIIQRARAKQQADLGIAPAAPVSPVPAARPPVAAASASTNTGRFSQCGVCGRDARIYLVMDDGSRVCSRCWMGRR